MIQKHLKHALILAAVTLVFAAAAAQAAWTPQSVPSTQQLRALDGYSENKILAVGNGGTILLYNGTSWQSIPGITSKDLYGVWWAKDNEAFVAGKEGLILHFDGTNWTPMDSGTTTRLRNIWGTSAKDVFAVGDGGLILHYDGTSWSEMTSPTAYTIQSTWGSASDNIYAVGGATSSEGEGGFIILHYDGTQWTTQKALPSPLRFHEIWGEGSTVFAAGEGGSIFFTDTAGASWAAMNSNTSESFRSIWGASTTNVYAVGDSGTIMHYDGTEWSPESSGVSERLFSIWGSSAESIYAVGDAGRILHYTPSGTDNNTPLCPFIEAVDDTEDLQLLRAARDRKLTSISGICLVTLFYATAPETARIARQTPALRNKIEKLVAQNRPLLEALALGRSGSISKNALTNIEIICKELQSGGGTGLSLVLSGLRHGLKQGWLLNILDITIE